MPDRTRAHDLAPELLRKDNPENSARSPLSSPVPTQLELGRDESMNSTRRKFLKTLATSAAALTIFPRVTLLSDPAIIATPEKHQFPGSCDFVFFTDTHIQPELDATHGCSMAFQKIAALKPEFAIHGGDLVFDALGVNHTRADMLFDLYQKTVAQLNVPLYHAVGNHDIFGVLAKSGVAPADPLYAKKMFEDRIGARTYSSFDRKGYHFIILDSIFPTEDRQWEGRVDEAQLQWLAADLKTVPTLTPIVVVIHVPLVTGFLGYSPKPEGRQKYNTYSVENSPDVLALFEKHNVIAVLQGHLHVNEVVHYKNCDFMTSGAVCGNWWHGPRMGFPEGFTRVSLRNGKITTRYETYGFNSVDPREKF
jgi:3',5'-cyclic-AMP phosphodiesterase